MLAILLCRTVIIAKRRREAFDGGFCKASDSLLCWSRCVPSLVPQDPDALPKPKPRDRCRVHDDRR
jgi:hypothetical protein